MYHKFMNTNNYYALMQNNNNNIGVIFAVLAAVITSMMFMASQGGIKAAFVQANPMIPAAGQGNRKVR
jgi:uncharacterized membrane protein